MEDEKKKEFKLSTNGSYFKRAISDTYQQVVSDCVRVRTLKTEPEKVPNMVGTFLKRDSTISSECVLKRATGYTYQKIVLECIKVPTTKVESEKVTNGDAQ